MKKNILNIFRCIGIAGLVTLGSCEDFLTNEPIEIPVMETFWQTEADGNAFVNGIYSEFRSVLGASRHFEWGDFPAGMWEAGKCRWNQHHMVGNFQWFGKDIMANWSPFFKPISVANNCIENLGKIPLDTYAAANEEEAIIRRNKYLGEAHFMRALCYFYMVRLWGEVPIIEDYIKDVSEISRDIPMAKEEDILDFCLEDLEKAAGYLAWSPTFDKRAARATKGSVYALKAHIYMWKNRLNKTTIDRNNYTEAIHAIDSIEQSGQFSLVDTNNYINMFAKGGSSESLFEVAYSQAKNEYFETDGFTSLFLGYPYRTDFNEQKPIFVYSTSFIQQMNKLPNDWRRRNLFYNWGASSDDLFSIKYSSIHYTNPEKTTWQTDDQIVIFRLADIYLLKAEAYNRLNDDGNAKIYLQKVRSRMGVDAPITTSGDNLLSEIVDERERELFLEGHRLYDWVRTGAYYQRGSYTRDRWMNEGYLWPVAFELIGTNKYIRQTPYWADKMMN